MKSNWSRVVAVICSLAVGLAWLPVRSSAWSTPNTRAIVLSGFSGGAEGAGETRVTFDSNDNMILSGRTAGTLQVNPANTSQIVGTGADWQEYVSKFSSTGDWIWTITWPSSGGGELNIVDVKASPNGDIIIGASLDTVFDVDPGAGIVSFGSASFTVGILIAIDANGQFKWARQVTGTNSVNVYDIEVLADSTIIAAGVFSGTVNFDGPGGPTGPSFTAVGSTDGYVASFTSSGVENWAAVVSGSFNEWVDQVNIAPSGNIVVCGGIMGATTFTPAVGSTSSVSVSPVSSGIATYVWNLSPSGATSWVTTPAPGTLNSESPQKMLVRANGEIILATDDRDIHILNSSGVVTSTMSSYASLIHGITELTNGKILLAGSFSNTSDLDPTSGVDNRTSINASLPDGFVVKLSSNLQYEAAIPLQMTRFSGIWALTATNDGGWVLTGTALSGTITVANPANGTSYTSSTGADSMIFAVRYNADGTTTVPIPVAPLARTYVSGNKKVTV